MTKMLAPVPAPKMAHRATIVSIMDSSNNNAAVAKLDVIVVWFVRTMAERKFLFF